MIRPVRALDAPAITAIYNHYILNTVVTFELDPLNDSDIHSRIEQVLTKQLPWFVIEQQGEVVGFAYANTWKERVAYQNTAEITVYIAPQALGKGLGRLLYAALFEALAKTHIHSVIGVVTLPNVASEKLHEQFSMEKAAHFKEVGYKFDKWLDVGYWQGFIERDS